GTSCGTCDRELRVQRGTRIIELLVVLGFRSSLPNVPRVLANFGIGPLAPSWAAAAEHRRRGVTGHAPGPKGGGVRRGFEGGVARASRRVGDSCAKVELRSLPDGSQG